MQMQQIGVEGVEFPVESTGEPGGGMEHRVGCVLQSWQQAAECVARHRQRPPLPQGSMDAGIVALFDSDLHGAADLGCLSCLKRGVDATGGAGCATLPIREREVADPQRAAPKMGSFLSARTMWRAVRTSQERRG
ncbi:protein of unknown function [Cyanobium sp. NIES-981]|nr:protein of unknown function [Cyanobium sp. NIES-981]